MTSLITSYILGIVAQYVDVRFDSVQASLAQGRLQVRNVSVNREAVNKFLPFPIVEGSIGSIELQLPSLIISSSPLRVIVNDALLVLPADPSGVPK